MPSSDVVIDVRNISKSFEVAGDKIERGPSEPVQRPAARVGLLRKTGFKALDDVSFQVKRGETVGILGRNGAGKSTLLRIISGLMTPDSGSVDVKGEAYSVMGLGVGMKNDLTGAENIAIKAAVMGMSQSELDARYDTIIAFADLGDFIHQPLRTYSKGMRARLAFAITFAIDPEILIIDESMSGGDAVFKRKTAARIDEIQASGATILIVSHGNNVHNRLCSRSILLDRGRKLTEGPPKYVIQQFQRLQATRPDELPGVIEDIRSQDLYSLATTVEAEAPSPIVGERFNESKFHSELVSKTPLASPPNGGEILDAGFQVVGVGPVNVMPGGGRYEFVMRAKVEIDASLVYGMITIRDGDGLELGTLLSHPEGRGVEDVKAGRTMSLKFKVRNHLGDGIYYLDCALFGVTDVGLTQLHRVGEMVRFQSCRREDSRGGGLVDFS